MACRNEVRVPRRANEGILGHTDDSMFQRPSIDNATRRCHFVSMMVYVGVRNTGL